MRRIIRDKISGLGSHRQFAVGLDEGWTWAFKVEGWQKTVVKLWKCVKYSKLESFSLRDFCGGLNMLQTLWNGLYIKWSHANLKKIGLHEFVFSAFSRSLPPNEWNFVDVDRENDRWR
jgi:hypothetical protein